MIAYNFEKSKLGIFGFDTLNIFTHDEIYCSGFKPNETEIDLIGNLCQNLKRNFTESVPVQLYITKKSKLFWVDVRIVDILEPLFADSQGRTITEALQLVEKKILINRSLEHNYSYSYKQDFYQPYRQEFPAL